MTPRVVAALFAILGGTFGLHKFYLRNIFMGIIYLCLSWTGIPTVVGWIEGVLYLIKSDAEFERKYLA